MANVKGRTAEKIFKRDMALIAFMREHRGAENVVGSKEIADFLKSIGFEHSQRGIGELLSRLMYVHNAPIVFDSGKGYFWAKNADEIRATISNLQSRIDAINQHIDFLKNFVMD